MVDDSAVFDGGDLQFFLSHDKNYDDLIIL